MSVDRIRLARPAMGREEVDAVASVLASGMLVQGKVVERFEAMLAERVGRRHAIAVSSGTAALSLALRALDVTSGEVLVPDVTWPSPAHVVHQLGARAALVAVDGATWNGDPSHFASLRTPDVRAAIVIDQFGSPAAHGELEASLRGLPIIEDAACAIGSTLAGRACGSFGLVSCFSFHPRKVLTTGEGGACLTDDDELASRLRRLRNHGQSSPGVFVEASGNERLTELQAAIGIVQLGRLDGIVARRRTIAAHYRAHLPRGWSAQRVLEGARTNEQTFGIVVSPSARDALLTGFDARGIEAGRLSYALHRLDSLATARRDEPARYVSSRDIVDGGFAIPLHTELSDGDVERITQAFTELASLT